MLQQGSYAMTMKRGPKWRPGALQSLQGMAGYTKYIPVTLPSEQNDRGIITRKAEGFSLDFKSRETRKQTFKTCSMSVWRWPGTSKYFPAVKGKEARVFSSGPQHSDRKEFLTKTFFFRRGFR